MRWLLTLGLVLVASAARAESLSVIAVGDDPVAAGTLQHAIEAALRDRFTIVNIASSDPVAAGDIAEAERALEAAKEAFYQPAFETATKALATAEQALADALARDQRVRIQLWRTAILLATKREESARAAVELALQIDPGLQVSLAVFFPSLAEFVDRVRKARRTVHVEITDIPPDASIRADGVLVAHAFDVLPGTHRIVVTAPGRRAVEIQQAISIDTRLAVPIPFAVPDHDRLLAVLRSGSATKFAARTVLVGVYDGVLRAQVAGTTSAPFPLVDRAGLVAWIRETLSPTPRKHAARTMDLAISATIAIVERNRSLSGATAELSQKASGVFVEIAASTARPITPHWALIGDLALTGTLLAQGDLGYSGIPRSIDRARAGNSFGGALNGGLRRVVGPLVLALVLDGRYEKIGSRDVEDTNVFDPASFIGLGGGFEAGFRYGRGFASVAVSGSLILVAISGTQPAQRTEISIEAGVRIVSAWTLAAQVRADNVRLEGGMPTQAELSDSQRQESTGSLGIRIVRAL